MIELHDITKAFGSKIVLSHVSLRLEPNKTTVILGPSGTGKSVLLKILVGLLRPDEGYVSYHGRHLGRISAGELLNIRKKMGMLFQDSALFDSLSVLDNVAFPLRCHRAAAEKDIPGIVADKLAMVGLSGVERKMPSELSGGMRKRVALARAIVMEPEVLLFDEPNSGLDPLMSDTIDELIINMKQRLGITFFVISHDIVGTMNIADHIGMLHESELVVCLPKQEFLASNNPVIRAFLKRYEHGIRDG